MHKELKTILSRFILIVSMSWWSVDL